MFLGSFVRELDNKGRIILPAKLKKPLDAAGETELVLTVGFDRCLYLFGLAQWTAFVRKEIETRSEYSKDARQLKRALAANAVQAEIDKQARVLIPKSLQAHLAAAGRDSDSGAPSAGATGTGRVVVIGAMDHIEIWAEAAWQAFQSGMREDLDAIAEKISETKNV